jgi:hypothetical protein
MAHEQPGGMDLESSLKRAIEAYEATWKVVDSELYDLCRRRPGQQSFTDVFAKVAIIDHVYVGGLPRSTGASNVSDAEARVSHGLMGLADLIEQSLRDLAGRQFDRVAAAKIVELHGRVTSGLRPYTGQTWQQSFVSKYLHFHCDLVPIFDGNAQSTIGRYVDWQAVTPVRDSMAVPPDWERGYRNFVAAFVVLWKRISTETSISASVRKVDYLLWRPT